MRNLITILLTFIAILFLCSIAVADQFYLSPYEWCEEKWTDAQGTFSQFYWCAPRNDLLTGSLDLRSIPQKSLKGGVPQGYGIFAYKSAVNHPDNIRLGNRLNGRLSTSVKNNLQRELGVTITSTNIKDLIWELFTLRADPTGQTRWKPLRPDRNSFRKLRFRKQEIKRERFTMFESSGWEIVLASIHEDFKWQIKNYPIRLVQKHLGWLEEKYGVNYRNFIPMNYPQLAKLKPETTLNEDWNCANSGSLTCDLTWGDHDFSLTSNQAAASDISGNSLGVASHDLSSDDHYAEVDVVFARSTNSQSGVACRADNKTDKNYYAYTARRKTTDTHQLWSVSSGTFTQIGSSVNDGSAPTVTFRVRLEVDGSSLDSFLDSVAKNSETDTGITGILRTGVVQKGSRDSDYDDWEAGDLAVVVTTQSSIKDAHIGDAKIN